MKKKIKACLIFLVVVFLLTGCIKLHTTITINEDGSGNVEYLLGVSPALLGENKNEEVELFTIFRNEASKRGFSVSEFDNASFKGLKATKSFNNIEGLKKNAEMIYALYEDSEQAQLARMKTEGLFSPDIKMKKTWFYTEITLDEVINLKEENQEEITGEEAMHQQIAYKLMEMGLTFNFPVSPFEYNASKVTNNGRTLTWEIKPGEVNEVFFKVRLYRFSRIITGAIAALLIFIIIFYLAIKKPGKQ